MSVLRRLTDPLATAAATVSGNLYLVVGSLFFGLATTLFGLVLPPGKVFRFMGKGWGRTTLWACGARIRARFEEPLAADGRYILMPNHQSLYDIPALLATLPGETRFLAKESLFRIPVFGWSLRTGGFIPVDRSDRSRAGATFRAALDGLEGGVSVLLFPEETRSRDGKLQPFKRGGFLMAVRTGLPIVPVGIDGTLRVRARGTLLIRPSKVTVHYGRPLDCSGLRVGDMKLLMREVHDEIKRLANAVD